MNNRSYLKHSSSESNTSLANTLGNLPVNLPILEEEGKGEREKREEKEREREKEERRRKRKKREKEYKSYTTENTNPTN